MNYTINNNILTAVDVNVINLSIPNNVTSLGHNVFQECLNLETVTFEQGSVCTIIGNAFQACSNLKSINIPTSVTNLGDFAFQGCSKLETVSFDKGSLCTTFGMAFQGCSSLTSINVPPLVTNLVNNGAYKSQSSTI